MTKGVKDSPATIKQTPNGKGWQVYISKTGRRVYLGQTYDYAVRRARELGIKVESPELEIAVQPTRPRGRPPKAYRPAPDEKFHAALKERLMGSGPQCPGNCEPFAASQVRPGWICGACRHFNRWSNAECYFCAHTRCQGISKPEKVVPVPWRSSDLTVATPTNVLRSVMANLGNSRKHSGK